MPAHHALQRGHFDDHARDEVGLGERRRTGQHLLLALVQPQHLADDRRQPFQTVNLIQHAAEIRLEGQRRQVGQKVGKLALDIPAVEKGGVGEARVDNVFVAGADDVQVLTVAITHGDEIGQQRAVRALHGEVALVLSHHRNQHLWRQLQVALLKAA